jgi:hypothetical protein
MSELTEYKIKLLMILDKPKYLDLGRSPASAISACFELVNAGYVTVGDNGLVSITDKSKEALKNA